MVDTWPGGLDTGCRFRSAGPLRFTLRTTRAVNADGTLQNATAMVAAGVIGSHTVLAMPVWDVDAIDGEVDAVFVNGHSVGVQGAVTIPGP